MQNLKFKGRRFPSKTIKKEQLKRQNPNGGYASRKAKALTFIELQYKLLLLFASCL
jgi:hypothetical protein